jgi:argininosuccinate lyase
VVREIYLTIGGERIVNNLLNEKRAIDPFGRVGGKKNWSVLDYERRDQFVKTIHSQLPLFVKVHQAWLLMLAKQGIVKAERAGRIMAALADIDDRALEDMINNWNPASWEPLVQLEQYLTSQIGQIASDLNIARTIPPPFYRMELLPTVLEVIDETVSFLGMLLDNAEKHVETVMPGYTHLQHAQPMTYGHYLLGAHDPLLRALEELETAYARTNQFELGCGALSGTSFKIDRGYPAELLGFDGVLEHSNDSVAATDFLIDILSAVTNLLIPLSRVANDLDIWSSFEFSMVEVADEICNPSSMMPQKKNPALFEFCRMTLGKILGAYSEVVCGAHGTQYGDVIEMRELAFSIHPRLTETVKQLRIMNRAIDTLIVKKERMLDLAQRGFSTATELAAVLYRETSVPLRMAHGVVADIVRKMIDQGKSPMDITPEVVEQVSRELLGEEIRLSADVLRSSIDPVQFVTAHASTGGVAPSTVTAMISERRNRLEEFRSRQKERVEKRNRADQELRKAVDLFIAESVEK